MTVCLIKSLHQVPYIHCIYGVLANPTNEQSKALIVNLKDHTHIFIPFFITYAQYRRHSSSFGSSGVGGRSASARSEASAVNLVRHIHN